MGLFNTPSALPASLFVPKGGYSVIPKTDAGIEDFSGLITFDLLIKESHAIEFDVSTQPIEKNSDLTYNIKQKLQTGSLVGVVSNWSLYRDSFLQEYVASETSRIDSRENHPQMIWEKLCILAKSKKRMKIVTSLVVYDDVIISKVETERDPDTGEMQEIHLTFQQMNVVSLRKTRLDTVLNIKEDYTSTPSTNTGAQQAKNDKQAAPVNKQGAVAAQPATGTPVSSGPTRGPGYVVSANPNGVFLPAK